MNPAWQGQIHSSLSRRSLLDELSSGDGDENRQPHHHHHEPHQTQNLLHPNGHGYVPIDSSLNINAATSDLESSMRSTNSTTSKKSGRPGSSRSQNPNSAVSENQNFTIPVPSTSKDILQTPNEELGQSTKIQSSGEYSDEEMINVTTYGSVNANARDFSGGRGHEASGSGQDSSEVVPMVEKMRVRLQFYFMNPLEKWQVKRQFPYKLAIQVIKIFFVTFQLCMFGTYRYANVNYTWDNKITFSHLFLMDWDSSREITTYPPTSGPLSVYTRSKFYSYIDHAVNAYGQIDTLAIGPYFYTNPNGSIAPMKFCVEKYVNGVIFGFNESYVFDSATETRCLEINKHFENFSSQRYFEAHNFSISFDCLLEGHLIFTLKTVRFRDQEPLKSPDCFRFDIDIFFDNRDHDGQVKVTLEAPPTRLRCKGDKKYIEHNRLERVGRSGVNYIVIGLCTLSLVLCCRAIYRAQLLKRESITFFKKYYDRELCVQERLDFLNFWYLLIIFNDILIIVGSALKEQIENKELTGEAWNVCSVLLGVGNLLVWFGVLRYLGFFRTYNVLILTLKRATPNVLRFLICAILIYAGFTFCGWLILGPYHLKFSTLSTTSECLFALINGDDMFATFASMSSKSSLLWWFCRFYLYTFISLYIYVVLSLFIALIMDAYETIKLYYTDGFPRSMLEEFVCGGDIDNHHSACSAYSSVSHDHDGNGDGDDHNGDSRSPSNVMRTSVISRQQSVNSEVGRRMSTNTTAGGILDTIVETICGCKTPSPDTKRTPRGPAHDDDDDEQLDETRPLIQA